jgi:hypothetical protein
MRPNCFAIVIASSAALAMAFVSACRTRHRLEMRCRSDARPHSVQLAGVTRDAAATEFAVLDPSTDGTTPTTLGPGFPVSGPWVSFYGSAAEMGDLAKVARTYRIINLDADLVSTASTTPGLIY